MKRLMAVVALLFSLLMLSVSAFAQVTAVPQLMNFQGRLAKPDGAPVADGTYSIRFSLHSALTGGTENWNQTVANVVVRKGTFAVQLSGFPANTFNSNQWLQIKIGTDAPLSPRQQLVTVAYAFKADMALTVPDASITNARIANGTLTADKFAANIFNPLAWLLGGNSNTNPASHFIGTTDNQSLVFKTNNQRALKMQYVLNQDYLGNNLLGGYWLNSVTEGVTGATVFGGLKVGINDYLNRVTDHGGTVGGGMNNQAGNNNSDVTDAWFATVGGGESNIASGNHTTLAGGFLNTANGDYATIGGGFFNTTFSMSATVAGGSSNTAGGNNAAIGGGQNNATNNSYATVAGGYGNTASGYIATVGGGQNNTADYYATVAGGQDNVASGDSSTVAGGLGNTASGYLTTVGGGGSDIASGDFATVAGGFGNTASGYLATVGGGASHIANGNYSTIAGGLSNTASLDFATVAGGQNNAAAGSYSFAAGRKAKANHDGAFVWADSTDANFASTAANEFNVRASGGVRIFTKSDLSIGVTLLANDSSWHSVSDRNAKTAFENVDTLDVLERLVAIPISTWNYKDVENPIRHIGPMAQDFFAAFKVGMDDKHIGTIDADGVALAAIQGLNRKLEAQNKELKQRLIKMDADNVRKDVKIKELEARLERLEAALRNQK